MNLLAETGHGLPGREGAEGFASFDYGDWLAWFEGKAKQRASAQLIYDERPLSSSETDILAKSIAQFQLGEISDGVCLVNTLTSWAMRAGRDDLIPLGHHLVREAQHHAFLLGEFMAHHDLPTVKFHPLDTGFRIIRRMGGTETMLSTLLIAELIATHYYQCLGSSTRSSMLKRISVQLLEDENAHIALYRKLLKDLRGERTVLHNSVIRVIEHLVFVSALIAVWPFHHKVYRRAGTGLSAFWHIYWTRFRGAISTAGS